MEERVKVALAEIKTAIVKALDGCSEMEVITITAFIAAGLQDIYCEAIDESKLCLSGDKEDTHGPIGAEISPNEQSSRGEEYVE